MKRFKIISILMLIIMIFSASVVFADNETPANTAADAGTVNTETTNTAADANAVNTEATNTESNTENENTVEGPMRGVEDQSYKTHDVFLSGDNVTVDYVIDGNLFVRANTVTINSQIGGDVFVIAKNVNIGEDGYIFNNMFVISQNVDVKGIVFDVYGAVNNFTISDGCVRRDLKLISDNLNINGMVGRDALVATNSIKFNTDGKAYGSIVGNLKYFSSNKGEFDDTLVKGTIDFVSMSLSKSKTVGIYLFVLCSFVLLTVGVYLIGKLVAPKFIEKSKEFDGKTGKQCLKLFGIGILAVIIVPIICAILTLLKVTACVSVLIATLFVLLLTISLPIFVILLNDYLCGKMKITKKSTQFLMLVAFSVIAYVVYRIPYVGAALTIITALISVGNVNYIIFKKDK